MALSIAELQHDASGGFQKRRSLPGNPSVKIQSIGTAIEGLVRVKVPHLRFELVDVRCRYVRRIANDEIEPDSRRNGSKSIAVQKLNALD